MGGQKHFFLETHAAVAVPTEDGKMVVTCGTQAPTLTQNAIATALGVPLHKVHLLHYSTYYLLESTYHTRGVLLHYNLFSYWSPYWLLTTHYSLLTTHYSLRTYVRLTTHYLLLTILLSTRLMFASAVWVVPMAAS